MGETAGRLAAPPFGSQGEPHELWESHKKPGEANHHQAVLIFWQPHCRPLREGRGQGVSIACWSTRHAPFRLNTGRAVASSADTS